MLENTGIFGYSSSTMLLQQDCFSIPNLKNINPHEVAQLTCSILVTPCTPQQESKLTTILVKRCARSGHRTREDQILIFNAPDNQRTEGGVMRMREVRGRPGVGRT